MIRLLIILFIIWKAFAVVWYLSDHKEKSKEETIFTKLVYFPGRVIAWIIKTLS